MILHLSSTRAQVFYEAGFFELGPDLSAANSHAGKSGLREDTISTSPSEGEKNGYGFTLGKKKNILKTAAKDGARNIRILARWLEARLDRSNEIFANEERKRCSTGGKIIDAPTFIGRTGVA
jgi:hypothetical protein